MEPRVLKNKRSLLLVAAFAAVYVFWGSTYLAIRFAIETLPPFMMAGSRFLVAGSLLLIWARLSPNYESLDWSIGEPALSPALSCG